MTHARPANRLVDETSLYLRQHAHNPVDWYPWGAEALQRAQTLQRPIFLSIGYSACHWCHVMERESFEDETVAAFMNEHFVNIKVDREERPDLDQVYQLVVQMTGKSGGWPLSVFLLPDTRPFFGGTYFPPVDRYGIPSFRRVLQSVVHSHQSHRDHVEKTAQEFVEGIRYFARDARAVSSDEWSKTGVHEEAWRAAAHTISSRVDEVNGGFGRAPKFPNTMSLHVLMLAAMRAREERYLQQVVKTLHAMASGGIRDQLAGGFHRYSTDAQWLVPHFEKMLYDNALLADVYVEAWKITKDEAFERVARETLAYVLREMRTDDGTFCASQDADSEGEEGRYFVWGYDEWAEVLGADAEVGAVVFGVSAEGNMPDEGARGQSVLHQPMTLDAAAHTLGMDVQSLECKVASIRQRLLAARSARTAPARDDKVITGWNALMIRALWNAAGAWNDASFAEAAKKALSFLRDHMWQDNRLMRIRAGGRSQIRGFLEDYAHTIHAAIDAHEFDLFDLGGADDTREPAREPDTGWLAWARQLTDAAIEQFWDAEAGVFWFGAHASSDADASMGADWLRTQDNVDTSTPSGTSAMTGALLRLATHTGREDWVAMVDAVMQQQGRRALVEPSMAPNMVSVVDHYLHGPTELTVYGSEVDPIAREMFTVARREYLPHRALRCAPSVSESDGRGAGAVHAVLCVDRTCTVPMTSVAEVQGALHSWRMNIIPKRNPQGA